MFIQEGISIDRWYHHVLLKGDSKLVVASTQPMKELYWQLVQSNVSFFVEAQMALSRT